MAFPRRTTDRNVAVDADNAIAAGAGPGVLAMMADDVGVSVMPGEGPSSTSLPTIAQSLPARPPQGVDGGAFAHHMTVGRGRRPL